MEAKVRIGIRPVIDGRKAERSSLEEPVMALAKAAKELIESKNLPPFMWRLPSASLPVGAMEVKPWILLPGP